jgi:hypothetical protein
MRVLLFLFCLLFCTTAQADSRQLALTRIIISETGFQLNRSYTTHEEEGPAIAAVLRGRSSVGRVTMGIMREYSPKSFNKERTDSRRWISFLWARRVRPQNFPRNLSWSVHYPRFMEVYRLSGRILRGETEEVQCIHVEEDGTEVYVKPDHWGAPVGWLQRMRTRQGWSIVDCGNTVNDFWITRRN